MAKQAVLSILGKKIAMEHIWFIFKTSYFKKAIISVTFELCLSSAIAEIMLQNELLDHQVRFNVEGFKEIVTVYCLE